MARRAWCFTLFLDNESDPNAYESALSVVGRAEGVRYCVGQLERCGSSARLHIQGYAELHQPMRLSGFKKLFGPDVQPHIEPRKGTREQADAYCRKEDSHVAGPWTYGVFGAGGSGTRTDLLAIRAGLDAGHSDSRLWDDHFGFMLRNFRGVAAYRAVQQPPERKPLDVRVYWGPSGTGKSHRAYAEATAVLRAARPAGSDQPYIVTRPSSGEQLWFDGYQGEEAIILDDFYGWIKWSLLLRILDHYPLRIPVKGSFVCARWTHVFITSNSPAHVWYSADKLPNNDLEPLRRRVTQSEHLDKKYIP